MSYNHQDLEKKWQEQWEKESLYQTFDSVQNKENFFALVEFAYPSGNLHVGHWYAYAVPDMYARYQRMRGYNVLFPFGFDSFGLPAENAAIKNNVDPQEWTYRNIDHMRHQMKKMGTMIDWNREIRTSDPEYYHWTQWIFLQMFQAGLVAKKKSLVNWDPVDMTVLANEQVLPDGTAERSGAIVEKRELEEWAFKITDYTERLLQDLDQLDWSESIKEAQRQWIGKSEGAEITFKLSTDDVVKVFTTRPDTLFGVTYVVLAPEHSLVTKLLNQVENRSEVENYINQIKNKSELERQQSKEKTGVELRGVTAINPANNESVSVWIADYVLAGYGTGAVMAVPAHDERDFEFAKKFDLPIRQVIAPVFGDPVLENFEVKGSYGLIQRKSDNKILLQLLKLKDELYYRLPGGGINAGESEKDGLFREIEEETGFKFFEVDAEGYTAVHFHKDFLTDGPVRRFKKLFLLDFEKSVQGIEKPEEYEAHCTYEWHTLEDALSLMSQNPRSYFDCEKWLVNEFFNTKAYSALGILVNSGDFTGQNSEEAKKKITEFVHGIWKTTYKIRDWGISRQRYWGCPIPIVYDPKGKPHPIPDQYLPWTLPKDVDFKPDGTAPLARSQELKNRTEKIFGKGWTSEVDTMDTFVDSSWYFLRYLDPHNTENFCDMEKQKKWMPVNFYAGGAEHTTLHLLYSRFFFKAMYDLQLVHSSEPYKKRLNRSLILAEDGRKMSKRWGNVVNPDEQVEKVGADSVRTYLAFIGPYNEVSAYPWNFDSLVGVRRFIEKVMRIANREFQETTSFDLQKIIHKTIDKVTHDIERLKTNTAVASLMECATACDHAQDLSQKDFALFIKVLAIFAPHVTEHIWRDVLGNTTSIHNESWPVPNPDLLIDDIIHLPIQVNGKVRGSLEISASAEEEEIRSLAEQYGPIKKWLEGKKIISCVYVKGRIMNFVIE